jgi:hypothetical protein
LTAQQQSATSIATTFGDDEGCRTDEVCCALQRPAMLSILSPECADLLYMDRGKKKNKGSVGNAWPYAYEQPRRRKGNNDTWRNAGGKRAVLRWRLTGFQAGDILERRAGKITQADASLPALKYHAYCVTRDGKPVGCHIFHVNPTGSLIPTSMPLASQTMHRSTPPGPFLQPALQWWPEGPLAGRGGDFDECNVGHGSNSSGSSPSAGSDGSGSDHVAARESQFLAGILDSPEAGSPDVSANAGHYDTSTTSEASVSSADVPAVASSIKPSKSKSRRSVEDNSEERTQKQARLATGAAATSVTAFVLAIMVIRGAHRQPKPDHDYDCRHASTDTLGATQVLSASHIRC